MCCCLCFSSFRNNDTITTSSVDEEKPPKPKFYYNNSSSRKNGTNGKRSSFSRRCVDVVNEQRARLYIIRRCVTMLVCWHDYEDA